MGTDSPRGRILVTGAGGQVGGALVRTLTGLGEVVAPERAVLDLADAGTIRRVMQEVKPRWVVNAGAYTAVDKAESEPELARAINGMAPGVLGEEARKVGAAVVHFSTDYVFDGTKEEPYVETDATGPLNVYGATKLEGELALAGSGAAHLIFRTSWVYGATGKNFLRSMARMAREREVLRIVSDQHGAPTWSEELARMTARVIAWVEEKTTEGELSEAVIPVAGVYHATGTGETTWFGFAQAVVEELRGLEPEAKLARVEPITTLEYPTPAKRPTNSRLDCGKLERTFGWRMPEWRESVKRVTAELALGAL
ncbi:MAG TPA: dTDP-4-dehydrorhamnose reductase [Acidobacteriaceae bacterium]|nr:dTDP-4-dehydrorhamnose reductase [Acidobacteriaceae bacterium]